MTQTTGAAGRLRVCGATISCYTGCWEPFWEIERLDSRYDPEGRVPFRGRRVLYDNVSS